MKRFGWILALLIFVGTAYALPPAPLPAIPTFTDIITKGPWVDLRAFLPAGYVSNGSVDYATQILAANAAAKAAVKPLFFPPGIWRMDSGSLDAGYSGAIFIGAGSGLTTIDYNGTGFFIDGAVPTGVTTGYFGVKIAGLKIDCAATAAGSVRLGRADETYGANKWYVLPIIEDVYAQGAAAASSIGFSLNQVMLLKMKDTLTNYFDINWKFIHVAESSIDHARNQSFVTSGIYFRAATGSGSESMDGTIFRDIALSGVGLNAVALDFDSLENFSLHNIFIEEGTGTPTTLFKIFDCSNVYLTNILLSGTFNGTKLWDIQNPREMSIDGAHFTNLNIGPFNAIVSTVSITYPAGIGYTTTNFWGGVKLINCSYMINKLFSAYPGVQILSAGISGKGWDTYNKPITGTPFGWARPVLNLQGKSFMPEGNLVFSAWHGSSWNTAGTTFNIVADADCTGGYGISLPVSTYYFGPKFQYPSELMLGNYEVIVRAKSAAGTPAMSVSLLAGSTNVKNSGSFTLSTTMGTYSWKFDIDAADMGAETTITFLIASDATQILIVDYIVIRPFFNDIVISPYVAPTTNSSNAGSGNRIITATAAPTTGVWNRGDIAFNTVATTGTTSGWICILGGTPGTWEAFTSGNALTLLGSTWAAPAAIGTGTPAAGTFTTISAGGGGFGVDADGDVTMKSATVPKTSGVAGQSCVYDDYLTEVFGECWEGSHQTGALGANRIYQFPTAAPAGSMMVFPTPTAGRSTATWAIPCVATEIDAHTAASPTAAQLSACNATSIHNYNQAAADVNVTLPTTAANLGFMANVSTAQGANYWRFTAASSGTIYLNGSLTGKDYVQYTTPTVGAYFSCFTVNIGNAYKWYCADGVGTLVTN